MIKRIFQRRTIKITGLHEFSPVSFLKRLHVASIDLQIIMRVNSRTEFYFSVCDYALPEKNIADFKYSLLKNLLDGCAIEHSLNTPIPKGMVLFHVSGPPKLREHQIEVLISKLLDLEINACIFLNLTPVGESDGNCSFQASFSIGIVKEKTTKNKTNLYTISTLIQSIYDSVYMTISRKPFRDINKLIFGDHIHSTILDISGALAYFQLPLTYGIEPIIMMEFPPPSVSLSSNTGIELGVPAEFNIHDIDKIRLDPNRLFEHMAVWGASGTGKTTFLKNMLIQLEKSKVKFCILDWHNEYRDIVTKMNGNLGDEIFILNPLIGSLSINPLQIFESKLPKDIQIWERIENFISLLKQMYRIGEIQEARIRQALSTLYSGDGSPTISDAIIYMSEKKLNAITLKLDKFTKGYYGQIFNRRKSSLSFSELRRKNVIIELGQLPGEVRMFFASVFLILWWDSMKNQEKTPNVLVLDDFYRYANMEVIKKMLSEARKFRQGLICSHQGPYQLPQGIREEVVRNTASKVIFRQEQTWDKHIVRDALGGMTKEQLIQLSYLDIGQAIVKIPSAKSPMRINTPPPPQTKLLPDLEIEQSMKRFTGNLGHYEEPKYEAPFEKKFLLEIHNSQKAPLTEITKTLGIKTKRGYELKDKLIREGLLKEDKIRKGIGRPRIILKLTKKGIEYIDEEPGNSAPQYGKSEHVFIKERIFSILKDWEIKIEDGCDIRAEKNGLKVAIEVETGKSNEKKQILYNVKRDSVWADKIVVVCPNKEIKLQVMDVIQAEAQFVVIITYREIGKIEEILAL